MTASPAAWKRPWFTSDRWRDDAFAQGKPKEEFLTAHGKAETVVGPTTGVGAGG